MNTISLYPCRPISPFQTRTVPMQSASIPAPAQISSTIDLISMFLPVMMIGAMISLMGKMMSPGEEEAQTQAPVAAS